ncbi:MAG: hypothetical protein ACI835_003561 [Planctomycetota bacterium]|jgi:hypothetical protein
MRSLRHDLGEFGGRLEVELQAGWTNRVRVIDTNSMKGAGGVRGPREGV